MKIITLVALQFWILHDDDVTCNPGVHSDWIPMRSSSHDALGQPPHSQTSNPSHSVFIMVVEGVICRLEVAGRRSNIGY